MSRTSSWHSRKIGELCSFESGHGFSPQDWSDKGLPIIRIQNLNGSKSFNHFAGVPDPSWIVEPGDILFAWAGVKGVSFGSTTWPGPRGVLNQHIYRIRPNPGVDRAWLSHALKHVTAEIEKKAHGFKTSLLHVRKKDITEALVATPATEEDQSSVAALVDKWGGAIGKTEQLIAVKKTMHAARAMKFLDEEADHWPRSRLSDIAERIQRQDPGGTHPLLTISSSSGFVRQEDKYSRNMAGESARTYTLLNEGDFSYNKGNSLRYEFGCIYQLQGYKAALVPSVYVSFRFSKKIDHAYMRHLFASDYLKSQLRALVKTGVRNNGLLNISPSEFLSTTVPLPPMTRQQMIGRVLDASQKEIDLLQQQLGALRAQKHGLMEKLLTGQWRINTGKAQAT